MERSSPEAGSPLLVALAAFRIAPALLLAPTLADPDLVALPLEAWRPLSDARAAIGALGDVRAHLGAAIATDNAEFWPGHPTTRIRVNQRGV